MNTNISKRTLLLLLLLLLLLGMCLIPLVGGIIGIVLVILSHNQKNKNLFKIGILGIVVTILVYTIVYILSQSFYDSTKQDAKLSQKVLFELKQDIEEYKSKYGRYPESLEALTKNNELVLINDPILLSKRDRNIKTTFEYTIKDGKYRLFSVGIDGKANTKDDIR